MQDIQDDRSTPSATTPRSSTLPRNFTFQRSDSPKTPEPVQPNPPTLQPPNPPRVRIKRRRPGVAPSEIGRLPSGDRLPSIELSESGHLPRLSADAAEPQHGLLAPESRALGRIPSPPKTPLAQSIPMFDGCSHIDWSDAQRSQAGESITRPNSVWSEISDSSSVGSSDTFPSLGDSCTSPESDANDPFVFPESKSGLQPPLMQESLKRKRSAAPIKGKWTNVMDRHLWLTYMAYLADPHVTPFKTLPGTVPPLGVCHRVARQAKKTWKGPRASLSTVAEDDSSYVASPDEVVMRREASAPAAEASQAGPFNSPPAQRSNSVATIRVSPRSPSQWPNSAASTRRRLRELCKRKPALSPHYQRLMQARSPSPFGSSSRGHFSSSRRSSDRSSFSTRDLNLNLATSTASTMQPGGPLSQLAREDSLDERTPPNRSTAHQKSQSLQHNLGVDRGDGCSPQVRRLASPFHPRPTGSDDSSAIDTRPLLDPPLELHHPRPLSGSMKRRARYPLGEDLFSDDPDTRQNYLEDLFRDSGGIGNGKRRIRSRGFSMGSMHNGGPSRHISDLFAPPNNDGQQVPNADLGGLAEMHAPGGEGSMEAPPAAVANTGRRLGSPFSPSSSGNVGFSNTFPRSLFPQGLDSIASLDQQRRGSGLEDPFTTGASSQRGRGLDDPFTIGPSSQRGPALDDPFVSDDPRPRDGTNTPGFSPDDPSWHG